MTARALLTVLLISGVARAATLSYRNSVTLPGNEPEGLSGITYAGDGTFWGVTDVKPALLKLEIRSEPDATITSARVVQTVPILHGKDYEGVALSSDGRMWISNEDPGVFEVTSTNGRLIATLPVPALFKQIVRNQGFESLTCSPDGKTIWTANERALIPDGNPQVPATPILSATRVRLLRYEIEPIAVKPVEQFEYQTSGVHSWGGQIGLCELAALPDGRLLALERSAGQDFSGVRSIRTRIFLVDVTGATDISKPPFDTGLVGHEPVRVSKALLFDDFVRNERGTNLEGLCVGPRLGPNRWTIIGAVDSTDGPMALSEPAVVSFELDLTAEPTTRPATAPTTGTGR